MTAELEKIERLEKQIEELKQLRDDDLKAFGETIDEIFAILEEIGDHNAKRAGLQKRVSDIIKDHAERRKRRRGRGQ